MPRRDFILSLGKLRQKVWLDFSQQGVHACFRGIDGFVGHPTTFFTDFSGKITNESRDNALKPRDKEGCGDRNAFVGHEDLVEVDHTDGDEPVQCHHGSNISMVVAHCGMVPYGMVWYGTVR